MATETDLTEAQWTVLSALMPPRKKTGRKRVDDRRTLNGILYVLRTGCRWSDLPSPYGSPTTCWRRLNTWSEDGTWIRIWEVLLTTLDERGRLAWARAFLDGSFVPAKKGELLSD